MALPQDIHPLSCFSQRADQILRCYDEELVAVDSVEKSHDTVTAVARASFALKAGSCIFFAGRTMLRPVVRHRNCRHTRGGSQILAL
jgi:hypothetical protein